MMTIILKWYHSVNIKYLFILKTFIVWTDVLSWLSSTITSLISPFDSRSRGESEKVKALLLLHVEMQRRKMHCGQRLQGKQSENVKAKLSLDTHTHIYKVVWRCALCPWHMGVWDWRSSACQDPAASLCEWVNRQGTLGRDWAREHVGWTEGDTELEDVHGSWPALSHVGCFHDDAGSS